MDITNNSIIYTVQEVSSILKLSVLTLYKYIKEGKLEAIEFGGHYRISKTSLETFINNHKFTPGKRDKNNPTEVGLV